MNDVTLATASFEPGSTIDQFTLGERLHAGAMGVLFRVTGPQEGFPLVMKVPRLRSAESDEALINFETEAMILPELSGRHAPRFVAAGDLERLPYIVTEWVEGECLEAIRGDQPMAPERVAAIGAAIADALHALHQQDTIHFDLKPDNVILRADGSVALIDYGIAHHAGFPDLLAEEKRFASGSAPYISPEQLLGQRDDTRSDIFALGVLLYELLTARLPFGIPATISGMKDRLWMDPEPPRARLTVTPAWLQEVILRCLEANADERYQSAAHVAFDLRHPDQVPLTERARRVERVGFVGQAQRWWKLRNRARAVRRLPRMQASRAPVIMVAVDTTHPDDERHPFLQGATRQILSLSGEFRVVCVAVVKGGPEASSDGTGGPHYEHLVRLRHWVEPLKLPSARLSLHVLEAAMPGQALVDYALANHVDLIVVGAPKPSTQAMAWWRSVASTVTANAHCSVHVVRVPQRADDA